MWDWMNCTYPRRIICVLINKEEGFGQSYRRCERNRCKDRDLRTAPSFPPQTLSGQGDNHGYGSEHGADRPPLFFPPHAASQTVSMCRNSLMRRFRICALKHVGRLWTKNPFRSPMPKPAGRYIMRRSLKTVIHANQLLSRSIYLLYKKESLWTESQRVRAGILFREYPDIKRKHTTSP